MSNTQAAPTDAELDDLLRGGAADADAATRPADDAGDEDVLASVADAAIDRMLDGEAKEGAKAEPGAEVEPGPTDAASAVGDELDADAAESPPAPPPPPPVVAPAPAQVPVPATYGTPMWLRPLAWLSRPVAANADARDAAGKVGLVTLLNACGLLVYVALRG